LVLPRPHPAQWRIKEQASRFNVLALGRRFGKTTLGEDVDIKPALEGYPVAWFAPTYKYLTDPWRDFKRLLAPVIRDKSETEHRIELVTGGILECWTLDTDDPARGRKYRRVVVDESGIVKELQRKWDESIRPTLTDHRGDGWFLGTPKGLNAFHALYQRGQDPEQSEWMSWQGPTSDNPYIDPAEIETARLELPERVFAQEYLAEFLSDGAGVFRLVLEAQTARRQAQRVEGHRYVFGVDWGRSNDFTVVSVIDCNTYEQVAFERFNQIDYHVQLSRLAILAQKFLPQLIVAEANAMGAPLIEQVQRMDLPVWAFQTTNASKAAAIEALALAFEQRTIRILDDKVQTGELLAYDSERLPSGMLRYGAPEGMHDDTVIALALAWVGACAGEQRPIARSFAVEA
jgi:hypothetical protein